LVYFDTSFLTPVFKLEATSTRVRRFLAELAETDRSISHLTRLEFYSAVAREVRMQQLDPVRAQDMESAFDGMIAAAYTVCLPALDDYDLARRFISRYETGLRAPDALHLAIAANRNATAIYSLDESLIDAGRMLGLPVSGR
jgi:uncharacterized protein